MREITEDAGIAHAFVHFWFQGMLEMNLNRFKIGGVNITGFQLVDSKNQTSKAKKFIDNWSKLEPTYWPGAGTRTLNVSTAVYRGGQGMAYILRLFLV